MDGNPNPILVSTSTILDLELPSTTDTNFVTSYKGYIYGPRDGGYKFFASADDSLIIHLSTVANSSDP
jgi:hypothetical protein